MQRDPETLHDLKRTARRRSLAAAALTETRITWNARASQYQTVLTTLGIAIFLVGFTLVLAPRIRLPILVPGLVLALYCLGWAVLIYLKPIPSTAPAAIDDTAGGQTLFGEGRIAQAIAAFDDAVAADRGYDTAVRRFGDAVVLDDQTPGVLLYLSAAETVRGDAAAADRWRDRAIALLDGSEPSDRNRQLAAAYYTALEWVAHDVPERAASAREQRDRAVALETLFVAGERVSGSAPDDARLTINDIVVADDTVDFDLDINGVDADDTVTLLAYERPVPDGPWVQPPTLSYFGPPVAPGQAPPLRAERACQPTEFRVDLYVNGAPADSATAPGVEPTC